MNLIDTPDNILKTVFGYQKFWSKQKAIINNILNGYNTLVFMPAGSGKSLCYEIAALCLYGTAIIVSPLISLMQDQVCKLKKIGVEAEYLNSMLDSTQIQQIKENLLLGKIKLLYVTPERLNNTDFLQTLDKIKISFFAIDEAHCIPQWGTSFRPEYKNLGNLKHRYPQIPQIVLATITNPKTISNTIKYLQLKKYNTFITPFNRKNIYYSVKIKKNEKEQLLSFIKEKHQNHSGIIYCISQKRAEMFAAFLKENGYKAYPYHSSLNKTQKEQNQQIFAQQKNTIMVTTLAFGMGIDKSDIRFVVHIDLPKSLETYYQQVECAGIDGLASEAVIFYNLNDIIQLKKIIHNSTNNTVNKNAEFQKLNEVIAFVESIKCRRNMLLSYLGEEFYHNCNNCDNCKNRPEIFNANIDAKKVISCIYRIKQKKAKVGINYIIMFLRGVEDDKILNFSLHKLPSFGIGKDKNSYYWEAIIRQLIINNFLYYNFREKTLNLTTKSLNLIRGKCDIFLRKDILSDNNEKTKNNILTNKSNTLFLSPEEQDLFERLKELRKNLALEKKVPSYVIFHNKTLIDMVINKPKNIEELGNISGVGHCKLKIYGKNFIEAINSKQ